MLVSSFLDLSQQIESFSSGSLSQLYVLPDPASVLSGVVCIFKVNCVVLEAIQMI